MLRNPNGGEFTLTSNEMRKMYNFLKENGYNDEIMGEIGCGLEREDRNNLVKQEYINIPPKEAMDFAETCFEVGEMYKLGKRTYMAINNEEHKYDCTKCALTMLCSVNREFCCSVKCSNPSRVSRVIFQEV